MRSCEPRVVSRMSRIARAFPALLISFTFLVTLDLSLSGCGTELREPDLTDQKSLDGNWRISSAGTSDVWFTIEHDRVVSWSWSQSNTNEGSPELTSSTATISGRNVILSWSWFAFANDTNWSMREFAFSGTLQDDNTYLGTFTYHYSDNFVLFDLGEETYDSAMVRR